MEKSNSDKQKDDNTKDEDPGLSRHISNKRKESESNTDLEENVKRSGIEKIASSNDDTSASESKNVSKDDKTHQYHICNKKFTKRNYLNRHIKRVHITKNHVCDVCERKFATRLNIHRCRHFLNRLHPCLKCEATFTSKTYMNDHMNRMHNEDKTYMCIYCDKTFIRKDYLTDHRSMHTSKNEHICDVCKRTFKWKKTHKCKICNKFLHTLSLKKHIRMVHTPEKPHTCQHCGKSFRLKFKLQIHIKYDKSCKDLRALKLRSTSDQAESQYKCDYCNATFIQEQDLQRHKMVHKDEKNKCDKCGDSFNTKDEFNRCKCKQEDPSEKNLSNPTQQRDESSELKIGSERHKSEEKIMSYKRLKKSSRSKFQCQICDEVCNNEMHFIEHIDYHETVEDYPPPENCSYCMKSYDDSWNNWRKHKCKNKGTFEKMPYKCKCGGSFKTQNELERHKSSSISGACQTDSDSD